MNEVIEKEDIEIKDMIYEIRGVQVMIDSDLARLFNIETGNLNKAMKRNLIRFPKEFCFNLTFKEYNSLLFQNGIAKKKGGRTNLPYVYTEQGIAMLSCILHSDIAIKMSIKIINVFVLMRHYLIDNKDVYKTLNNINIRLDNHDKKMLEYDDKFEYLFSKFDRKERLLLTGEKYNAYLNLIDILNSSEREIIIIDPYADIILLSLLEDIKASIILIINNSERLNNELIEKYNNKYHNLKVIRDNSFHDRFIILDKKDYYHFGTSINSLGEKISMIIKLEDSDVKELLLNNIEKINE